MNLYSETITNISKHLSAKDVKWLLNFMNCEEIQAIKLENFKKFSNENDVNDLIYVKFLGIVLINIYDSKICISHESQLAILYYIFKSVYKGLDIGAFFDEDVKYEYPEAAELFLENNLGCYVSSRSSKYLKTNFKLSAQEKIAFSQFIISNNF